MLSDEEREAIKNLRLNVTNVGFSVYDGTTSLFKMRDIQIVLNLIEKQSKEIEELKETLKCTQNSWFEDTQKIEEMKKQIDLDNECEIALNNRIMDLEKEIEELKENNKILKNLQNDTSRLYIEMIERKNYFERKLEKLEDKIKAKIEEYKKQIEKMEKDDIGRGFTLGKEWSDLKAKVEFGQSLLEKE